MYLPGCANGAASRLLGMLLSELAHEVVHHERCQLLYVNNVSWGHAGDSENIPLNLHCALRQQEGSLSHIQRDAMTTCSVIVTTHSLTGAFTRVLYNG